MSQLAISYGQNAVPAMSGSADSSRIKHATSAVPAIGSGVNLPTISDAISGCHGVTKTGDSCNARPAKGTEWCVGHLRSRGEL